jgi:hypothetical protein
MTSPVRQYTDEIHDEFSYWATWLPTSQLKLGDCGPVHDRVFSPESTLDALGVTFTATNKSGPLDFQHTSQNGVEYTFQLASANQTIPQIPQGKAGVEVSFSKESGIVFVVREGYERRIEDLASLAHTLMDLVMGGDLPREYAVVTHVIDAASATVLISSGSDAKFVASAEADLKAGLLDLANAKANFSRVAAKNLQTELVAADGLTPLFKLFGFKKNGWFWGSPKVAALGFDDDADPGDLAEIEPTETDSEE